MLNIHTSFFNSFFSSEKKIPQSVRVERNNNRATARLYTLKDCKGTETSITVEMNKCVETEPQQAVKITEKPE
jgi:hypothetical protein